ncbi:4Fe-4S dicluster domain-containing protein [Anoxybacterium hadale]|uniref:4Fe-4S dicluster domain-containing protein n=1 Tax=Anoxybacterium hadale TaxID=3408580 RepID=A0ACD1A877_9FIRM|nr:4Fe-4S dicluster domain-containing protein [Clostridiales bacterium]
MAKGMVVFDEERCKGCELCISVCPLNLLSLHETKINSKGYHPASVTEPQRCTGCGSCGVICPDGAISVFREEQGGRSDE